MTTDLTITASMLSTARKIARMADQGGTIAPAKARRLFPNRPTLHTHLTVRQAWAVALPGVDLDALTEALWA